MDGCSDCTFIKLESPSFCPLLYPNHIIFSLARCSWQFLPNVNQITVASFIGFAYIKVQRCTIAWNIMDFIVEFVTEKSLSGLLLSRNRPRNRRRWHIHSLRKPPYPPHHHSHPVNVNFMKPYPIAKRLLMKLSSRKSEKTIDLKLPLRVSSWCFPCLLDV